MKKNLGRFLLLFLMLVSVELFASTYKWSATANKSSAAVNEAIHLKYVCEFSDVSELYSIDFNPVSKSKEYSIKLLTESENIINDKRVNNYEFVAFAYHPGEILFDFDVTMKKTTQESIESTILGRDNAQEVEFTKRILRQKTLVVDVKETPVDLVGRFTVEVKKDTPTLKAYEPYHMEIIIKGIGNFEVLKPFEFKIDGVKVFSQKIIKKIKLTKDGYSGSWSQKLAFVSEHDFTLPKVTVSYFDIQEKTLKELSHELTQVKVEKGFTKEKLLEDTEDNFKIPYEYIYYVLTFLAGVLIGKIKFKKRVIPHAKNEKFLEKIRQAKSLDELAMILAIEDSNKYKKLIYKIESKNVTSLGDVKKMFKN